MNPTPNPAPHTPHITHHTPVSWAPSRFAQTTPCPFVSRPANVSHQLVHSSKDKMSQATAARNTQQGSSHGVSWDSFRLEMHPSSWMRTSRQARVPCTAADRSPHTTGPEQEKEEPIPNNRGDGDEASGTEDSYTPPMCVYLLARHFISARLCSKPAPGMRCRSGQSLSCHRVISCPAAVE